MSVEQQQVLDRAAAALKEEAAAAAAAEKADFAARRQQLLTQFEGVVDVETIDGLLEDQQNDILEVSAMLKRMKRPSRCARVLCISFPS